MIAQQCVSDDEGLAHDYDDGDFRGFSGCRRARYLALSGGLSWMATSGHIEGLPQCGLSALNETLALPVSRLPGERCQAGRLAVSLASIVPSSGISMSRRRLCSCQSQEWRQGFRIGR